MNQQTEDVAPMISPGYPKIGRDGKKGSRLVAGWQAVWSALADGEWHERAELVNTIGYRPEFGDLAALTLRSLIIRATQADLFDSEVRPAPPGTKLQRGDTGQRAWVRRADAANRRRVETAGAAS